RLQGGERLLADAYVVALGSYSPLLLRSLGLKIPVYPLKGYSITLPLGAAEPMTAPEVSLTDEAHKIVISRLGNRLPAAGTAVLVSRPQTRGRIRLPCVRANRCSWTSAACAITCAAGRARARPRWCCCMAGWMFRPHSSLSWTRCAANGTSTRPTGAAMG